VAGTLFAGASQRATHDDLFFTGLALIAAGAATFAFGRPFDAAARFRYRLFGRRGNEESTVRRDRVLRKFLGASLIVGGAACVFAGVGGR
jgi:hypothetical protein